MTSKISLQNIIDCSNGDLARKIIPYLPLREIHRFLAVNRSTRALCNDRFQLLQGRTHLTGYDLQNYPHFLGRTLTVEEMRILAQDVRALDLKGRLDYWVLALFIGKCQNLVESSLPGLTQEVNDELLTQVAPSWGQLEKLDLSQCNYITDAGLQKAAEHCPRLKEVDLTRCYHITDTGRRELVTNCPNLSKLILEGALTLTDEELENLAPDLRNLRHLSLSSTYISIQGLRTLLSYCPHLRKIETNKCAKIREDELRALQTITEKP